MKISVCVTTLNEEGTIGKLLESLLNQSQKPDEIVVVDGGSKDRTAGVVRHYQKKDARIRLFVDKLSAAEGRNIAVDMANNDIIAMTDAGCIAERNWLERLTEPFFQEEVDITAGFYEMSVGDNRTEALSYFLGVTPSKFNINFLPSGRSIAFRKEAWEKIGGFKNTKEGTSEDTLFNYKAVELGMKIARVKNAVVEWGIPESDKEAFNKFYRYAKGDAETKIFKNPIQDETSHNIKAVFILLRYLVGFFLLIAGIYNPTYLLLLLSVLIIYFFLAFRKVYLEFGRLKTGLWGIYWQLFSDIAVILGFLRGIWL
ncbi:glycosyltransferase [Candidatus Woesebacteria bacterium]|nr:glycosyltransferase [Candidatus Woesebacteria bacterium]